MAKHSAAYLPGRGVILANAPEPGDTITLGGLGPFVVFKVKDGSIEYSQTKSGKLTVSPFKTWGVL